MIERIKKLGNSDALILDRALMELVGLSGGDPVQITVQDGSILVTPVHLHPVDAAHFEAALVHVKAARGPAPPRAVSSEPALVALCLLASRTRRACGQPGGHQGRQSPQQREQADQRADPQSTNGKIRLGGQLCGSGLRPALVEDDRGRPHR
jgi:antitoxin component of MazEF toxin-antitoxin module